LSHQVLFPVANSICDGLDDVEKAFGSSNLEASEKVSDSSPVSAFGGSVAMKSVSPLR